MKIYVLYYHDSESYETIIHSAHGTLEGAEQARQKLNDDEKVSLPFSIISEPVELNY